MDGTNIPEESAQSAAPDSFRVVDVGFRIAGRAGVYDAGKLDLTANETVVVETSRGQELGRTLLPSRDPREHETEDEFPRVVRRATDDDLHRADHNRMLETKAREAFVDLARHHRLPVKPIRVHYRFDGGRAVVYFFAGERAEVRPLARDLSHRLHTRIELLQVGEREETRLVGGIGSCGRELCCSTWLTDFAPVSIKMAKEQGLPLNPSKLAGMCGRLKCCLRYEYDTYLDLRRALPRVGKRVQTVKGDGKVVKLLPLEQRCLVVREEDGLTIECTLDDLVARRDEATGPAEPAKSE